MVKEKNGEKIYDVIWGSWWFLRVVLIRFQING